VASEIRPKVAIVKPWRESAKFDAAAMLKMRRNA
jgi:hypothetical protein